MFRREIIEIPESDVYIPHPFELGSAKLSPGDFGGRDWGKESAIVEPLVPGPQKPYQNPPHKS